MRIGTAWSGGDEQQICFYSQGYGLVYYSVLSRGSLQECGLICWCLTFQILTLLSIWSFSCLCHSLYFSPQLQIPFLMVIPWLSTISDSLENIPSLGLLECRSKAHLPQIARGHTWPHRSLAIFSPLPGHSTEEESALFYQFFFYLEYHSIDVLFFYTMLINSLLLVDNRLLSYHLLHFNWKLS